MVQCSSCHHSICWLYAQQAWLGSSNDAFASIWLPCPAAAVVYSMSYGIHGIRCHCVLQPGASSIDPVLLGSRRHGSTECTVQLAAFYSYYMLPPAAP
jgi:hypothetical protein